MSEEGPQGGEGFPQAVMRGRHEGNSAWGGGGTRPFVSAVVGLWRGGPDNQTWRRGERKGNAEED